MTKILDATIVDRARSATALSRSATGILAFAVFFSSACDDAVIPPADDFGQHTELDSDAASELDSATSDTELALEQDEEQSSPDGLAEQLDESEHSDEELAPLGPLSGRWARLTVMASLAEVPVVGQVSTLTKAIQLVDMSQRGSQIDYEAVVCELWLETTSTLVETVFPERFVSSLEPTRQSLELTQQRLVAAPVTELRGVRLSAPDTDALPVDDADPRIWDQDGDGRPGMTVRVVGLVDGEIWLIQRAKSSWEAGVLDPSSASLGGLVQWSDEQVNLGSDNELLAKSPENYPDPDASKSFFRMDRLSATASCADAIAAAKQW